MLLNRGRIARNSHWDDGFFFVFLFSFFLSLADLRGAVQFHGLGARCRQWGVRPPGYSTQFSHRERLGQNPRRSSRPALPQVPHRLREIRGIEISRRIPSCNPQQGLQNNRHCRTRKYSRFTFLFLVDFQRVRDLGVINKWLRLPPRRNIGAQQLRRCLAPDSWFIHLYFWYVFRRHYQIESKRISRSNDPWTKNDIRFLMALSDFLFFFFFFFFCDFSFCRR